MKNLKIIIGIVLIVFGTITIIQMYNEESGAGLFGAFTGYVVFLIISIWLIYSATRKQNTSNNKIGSSVFNKSIAKEKNESEKTRLTSKEQKHSIQILKDKGVLTESEYQEKIDIINEQTIIDKIHKSTEYRNLKKVYESDLLTKKQFDEKTNKLIAEYKEYYSIFGENNYPEFTWELYKSMKVNIKLNISDYSKSDLYGKWKFKNGQLFLYHENETNKNRLKVTWTNGMNRYGEWEFDESKLNVKLYGTFKSDKVIFRIEELGSHIFVYFIDDKKHTTIKDTSENKNVW